MKKLKRFLAVILCLVLIQAPLQMIAEPVTVQAAAGKLVTEKGKKYYYYNGKKQTNCWKKIGNDRYYFGKNGAAYMAEKISGVKYNIVVKKIDGQYYGFNNAGHRVQGLNLTMEGKLYCFSGKNGAYIPTTTAKYRKAAKTGVNASTMKKLLGKPVTTVKMNDLCLNWGNTGADYIYKPYELQTVYDKNKGIERVIGLWVR